jgi:hypothetical protein
MDAQATCFESASQLGLTPGTVAIVPTAPHVWPAKQLGPDQRRELAVQMLAGSESVSDLAHDNQVSRKFLYQQAETAQEALEQAFAPSPRQDEILFYLPVTKAWLRQLVLGLVLICHCSLRNVVTLLRDLFDYRISLGNVHQIVDETTDKAAVINDCYQLAPIRMAALDEIFQAATPVLVGVDAASSFCFLLSLEEHRDAETWGVRLLELTDRGFAPEATIADGGTGLRAGQKLAMPGVPCWGDHFHLAQDLTEVLRYLENRAYVALEAFEGLDRKRARLQPRKKRPEDLMRSLQAAHRTSDWAVQLFDEVALLLHWLRNDILAVAGPSSADRRDLYDFVLAELEARALLCPHRLQPLCRTLKNQRDNFLAFARKLDDNLSCVAQQFEVSTEVLRRYFQSLSLDDRDPRRWTEAAVARSQLGDRFREVTARLIALAEETVRASSLVENLNSRLRTYFSLRRHLGPRYLALLQFFLNHRVLERSERPERQGKTPAQVMTGQAHPHWLEMLGHTRFKRS